MESLKPFQHRDKFFHVYRAKCPDWKGSGYVLHCIFDKFDPSAVKFPEFVFYVQDIDKLYKITVQSLLDNRAKEICRDVLTL